MRSFKNLIEQKLGKFPQFLIYAILEWIMIVLLFIDGLLAFVSTQFAKFFDLSLPCLLCTRIDHILIHRNSSFYYNDSICEVHKKDISALAYCDIHRKLSDIHGMCQGCLVGILHKDDCLLKPLKKDDNNEKSGNISRCSCCGETLKSRASLKYARNLLMNGPTPSPRASLLASRNEEGRNVESPRVRYGEVKFMGDREYSESSNAENQAGRENAKDTNNEDANRTPNFTRGNKFFAIPLNSAPASPRLLTRNIRKLTIEKGDNNIMGTSDATSLDEVDEEILNRMKRQVRLDQQSLMDLYMELDEERSASAVAANNAMAMITRLQAEKAAVQMEALQYQRMMDEQAEYDEEAMQEMRDMLLKREEEMKELECEVEAYRERYGEIKNFVMDSEICEVGGDEDYLERNSSLFDEKSDYGSFGDENGGNNKEELDLDFEGERSYLRGLLADLEKKINADEGSDSSDLSLIKHEDEGRGDGNNVKREVCMINVRLRAIEADSGFLKHAAMTLQRGEEGTKLLTEIAQHLRKLSQSVKSTSGDTDA